MKEIYHVRITRAEYKEYCQRCKELREQYNISRQQMADFLCTSRQNIFNFEEGYNVTPDFRLMSLYAQQFFQLKDDYFKVYLFGIKDEEVEDGKKFSYEFHDNRQS